jgi:hypothetical protein
MKWMNKIVLVGVLGFLTMAGVRAKEAQVQVAFRIAQGKDLLSLPSATVKPDTLVNMAVTQPTLSPGGLSLDTGVSVEGKAAWKDGKIAYDFLVRVRSFDRKNAEKSGTIQVFRTREFLVNGIAEPGKPVEIDSDADAIKAFLTLSAAPVVKPS